MPEHDYVCLPEIPQLEVGYLFCALRREDIESIRLWRNEQLDILRQMQPISCEEQKKYYNAHIVPSFLEKMPKQILFSILYQGVLIGYGGLVHIDWQSKKAEVSFLLDTRIKEQSAEFKEHLHHFLKFISHVAFEKLGLHKLVAEVYALRPCMVELLQAFGFFLEGRLKDHVFKGSMWHDAYLLAYGPPEVL